MLLQYKFRTEDMIKESRISKDNVDTIKIWLKDKCEEYIPKELPEKMIVAFLMSCENNVDTAKTTIRSYFKLINMSPAIHNDRVAHSKEMDLTMDIWSIASLPIRTKENYVIHYFKLNDGDYKKIDLLTILKITLMLVDVSLDKTDPPSGLVVIVDMALAGLMHLSKIKLDLSMNYFSFLQEGMPIKLQAIHYMNSNFVINKCMSMIKSLIKNDVFSKMYFHPSNLSMDKFHEYIPKTCLPGDLGGDLPLLKDLHENTKKQFEDKQEFWKMEEEFRKKFIF